MILILQRIVRRFRSYLSLLCGKIKQSFIFILFLILVQIVKYNTKLTGGDLKIFTFLFMTFIVRTAGIGLVYSSAVSIVAVWRGRAGTVYAHKIWRCFACARHTMSRVLDIKYVSDRIIPTLKMAHFIYKTKKEKSRIHA